MNVTDWNFDYELSGGFAEVADEIESGVSAMFGGQGSGPRPGHKSPWYERGSKKGKAIPGLVGDFFDSTAAVSSAASNDFVELAANVRDEAFDWLADQGDSPDWSAMPAAYAEFLMDGAPRNLGYFLDENPRVVAAAKAKMTKAFNAKWVELGATGKLDPQAPPMIRSALERVSQEPKIRRAVERFGPVPRVVLLAPGALQWSGLHSAAMGTIAMNASAEGLDSVRAQALLADGPNRVRPFGGATVGGSSYEAVFRHEFGHHVEAQLRQRSPEAFRMMREALKKAKLPDLLSVSAYSTGMFGMIGGQPSPDKIQAERFAELFGAVTHPDYSRDLFPEGLHAALRMMEALVS
jgi:hypothetical protein